MAHAVWLISWPSSTKYGDNREATQLYNLHHSCFISGVICGLRKK